MGDEISLDVKWYTDPVANDNGEPGVRHSFMACLATALNHISGDLDPIWLMGASTFAFRIVVCNNFCPSAISVFDWQHLPMAVRNTGFECTYIDRLWHQAEIERERRDRAHAAIVENLHCDRPAIVWDVCDGEWGLIFGFDGQETYQAYSNAGEVVQLPVEKLGRNGIDILSVTIPGKSNSRPRDECIRHALEAAVSHAEEKDWMERPEYRDGLSAYEEWATIYSNGALLAEAGKGRNVPNEILHYAQYYAEHYYSARRYARDFLESISDTDNDLKRARDSYGIVASTLRTVWMRAAEMEAIDSAEEMRGIAASIREAGRAEAAGITSVKKSLNRLE